MDEVEHAFVVGVDINESHATAALVDQEGHVLTRAMRGLDCSQSPHEVLMSAVVPAIEETIQQSHGRPVRAMGIALPGTLRPEEGLCLLSTQMGWEDVAVRDVLADSVGLPTVLINDVRALILGEMAFGAGRGIDNFVCVALGSTIEGGIVIDGRSYDGESDSAGEIGHITVDHDGSSCTCGNQGCLNTLASGPAVARMAAESLRLGAQSVLSDWIEHEQPMTARLVHQAALEGDALAIKIWDKVGRYLGLGLSAVITIVNPRRIILSGRVARAFAFFAPTMQEEIRRRARMVPRDYTELVPSPLGLDGALLGAARKAQMALALSTSAAAG